MYLFLGPGAQLLFKEKWGKWDTVSPLLHRIGECNSVFYFDEVVFICESTLRLTFSRLAFLRKRLQLDYKTDLITNEFWQLDVSVLHMDERLSL